MRSHLDRATVLAGRDLLPAFPQAVENILRSIDDPEVNLETLSRQVQLDPVLTGRVLARANLAANRMRPGAGVSDIYTATSLIGLNALRETVTLASLASFFAKDAAPGMAPDFWRHSAAVGICAQQLALHTGHFGNLALIAGTLHDVGQLWLRRLDPEGWKIATALAADADLEIDAAERHVFGVDHAQVGAWLAESWKLPAPLRDAIRHHHAPDALADRPLVALTHVAEVLSAALGLSSQHDRVRHLSDKACASLGLTWDDSTGGLFGRIEGISRYVIASFTPTGREGGAE